MLTELEATYNAVLLSPADSVLRSVYADPLEERSEFGDAEMAEFIRVQVALSEAPAATRFNRRWDDPRYSFGYPWDGLRQRERALWEGWVGRYWVDDLLGLGLRVANLTRTTGRIQGVANIRADSRIFAVTVARGFPTHVHITERLWQGSDCVRCGGAGWESVGPTGYPKCPECQNSSQNVAIADDSQRWRCASCKAHWVPEACRYCHGSVAATPLGIALVGRYPIATVSFTELMALDEPRVVFRNAEAGVAWARRNSPKIRGLENLNRSRS